VFHLLHEKIVEGRPIASTTDS